MQGSIVPGRFAGRAVLRHNMRRKWQSPGLVDKSAGPLETESTKALQSVLIARLRGTSPPSPSCSRAPRPRQLGLSLPSPLVASFGTEAAGFENLVRLIAGTSFDTRLLEIFTEGYGNY
jgi:hypothetical protein